jgi:hypothetical protein
MNQETYIWINEAVKVYDKTRQTFYNYINKNQIKTKKVKNKLYLLERDISRIIQEVGETWGNLFEDWEKNEQQKSHQRTYAPHEYSPYWNENQQFTPTAYLVWEGISKELETRLDLIDDFLVTIQEEQQIHHTTINEHIWAQKTTHHHDHQALIHLIQNNHRTTLERIELLNAIYNEKEKQWEKDKKMNMLSMIYIISLFSYIIITIARLLLIY